MSGVYIKGLKMPTGKEGVAVIIYPDGEAVVEPFDIGFSKYCKAISVPDHGRLVDADALETVMVEGIVPSEHGGGFRHPFDVLRALVAAPTIIPADGEEEV